MINPTFEMIMDTRDSLGSSLSFKALLRSQYLNAPSKIYRIARKGSSVLLIDLCVYVCVHMCLSVGVDVHAQWFGSCLCVCVEARGQPWVTFLRSRLLFFLSQDLFYFTCMHVCLHVCECMSHVCAW